MNSFCIGRNGAAAAVYKETGKVIEYILFNELNDYAFYNLKFVYL